MGAKVRYADVKTNGILRSEKLVSVSFKLLSQDAIFGFKKMGLKPLILKKYKLNHMVLKEVIIWKITHLAI